MGKTRHIYLKILCLMVLVNTACACRIFAGTIPYVSISYVGAGYAFETTGHDQDDHYLAADADADYDEGDQLHDVRIWSSLVSPCTHSYAGAASGFLTGNSIPLNSYKNGYACLKQALPLRI